jgi:hypothetical protein
MFKIKLVNFRGESRDYNLTFNFLLSFRPCDLCTPHLICVCFRNVFPNPNTSPAYLDSSDFKTLGV